jgi:hypothetical protein
MPSSSFLPIGWIASLILIVEPGLTRAEINIAGSPAPYLLVADQADAQLRFVEETRSNADQGASTATVSVGTWRLVQTPGPRGGPGAVSITQAADPSRTDVDLAGLMLRCSDIGFDVLIIFLKPFPPHAHPKVKLTAGGATVQLDATVISPGAAISLPAAAAALVNGSWQSSSELEIAVNDDREAVRGVISLAALGPALSLLKSNCRSR